MERGEGKGKECSFGNWKSMHCTCMHLPSVDLMEADLSFERAMWEGRVL